MQFIHADLGRRQRGDVVEITLKGNQANVLLLDSSGFNAFKRGRQARGVGGLAKRSPVRLTVPRTGRWYGVAYLPAGHRGRVKAGFRVLPGALPPIRQSSPSPLGSIRQAADQYADVLADDDMPDRAFDVFISHSGEDDVTGYSAPLAGKLARSTADATIEEIADEIAEVIGPYDNDDMT